MTNSDTVQGDSVEIRELSEWRELSYGSYGRVKWLDLTRQSVREGNVPEGELWMSARVLLEYSAMYQAHLP